MAPPDPGPPGADPPGIDCAAVARWLAPLVGGLEGPLRARILEGGRSNLTYEIGDGNRVWVLRRPPLAHVLPTAHDMAREHRVLAALGPTDIPVPAVVGLCEDPGVLGAPFYVMGRVEGHVVRDALPAAYPDTPATRARISAALVRTLTALHAVDPSEVGLGDLGRPAGFLERQVSRWWRQWELSRTRDLPAIAELRSRLEAGVPVQSPPGIVHGDYRLDNLILAPDDPGRVAAILDWEMCTTGDPLADLGLLLVYWSDRTDPPSVIEHALSPLTREAGFATRDELAGAYAAASSRDLSALDWYVCLGFFKLAVVAEGIHARHLMGMTVGEGFDLMGPRVAGLVDSALARASASSVPGLRG
ncbi:MAG TPA: phosphotransferase family protein [Candidatus Dormibacteraeota bacterium]|nr:phosphotransferase family protein [Candidatus Dormibacteraeota bacterium]